MIRFVLIVAFFLCCLGCTRTETWTAVEAERRRIATELKRIVPANQQDLMQTIVFDRPRTKPESIVTGYDHAVARVNRERLALAKWELNLRQVIINHKEGSGNRDDPDRIAEERTRLDGWAEQIKEAQRLVIIAEASQENELWLPVLDILLGDVLQATNLDTPSRTFPDSDKLRLHRAKEWFTAWRAKYRAVQP